MGIFLQILSLHIRMNFHFAVRNRNFGVIFGLFIYENLLLKNNPCDIAFLIEMRHVKNNIMNWDFIRQVNCHWRTSYRIVVSF